MANLIITSDGSHSIYVPEMDEHYHSVHGALTESMTVFIRNGYDRCTAKEINLLEIGFGTGLNALLTLSRSLAGNRKVNYTAIEKYPLGEDITNRLNYHLFTDNVSEELFRKIHSAPWNQESWLTEHFSLTKMVSDFTADELQGRFNLVYFDAFGPDKQPEMWEEKQFRKMESCTGKGAILVTYSSKGSVKRMLKACGFSVSLSPGPPGKREITRAVKIL